MATAREKLISEVRQLIKSPYNNRSAPRLEELLDLFRIQLKNTREQQKDTTARETIAREFLELWAENPLDFDQKIAATVDRFRMQMKQKDGELQQSDEPEKKAEKNKKVKAKAPSAKKESRPASLGEPVAGGPRKRSGARSQCPKCHSLGVVLARSYTGDEYFSCIYCGFQAYRAALEAELDLPLAAELLGRSFDERDKE